MRFLRHLAPLGCGGEISDIMLKCQKFSVDVEHKTNNYDYLLYVLVLLFSLTFSQQRTQT
jgi:hypothetical protein